MKSLRHPYEDNRDSVAISHGPEFSSFENIPLLSTDLGLDVVHISIGATLGCEGVVIDLAILGSQSHS